MRTQSSLSPSASRQAADTGSAVRLRTVSRELPAGAGLDRPRVMIVEDGLIIGEDLRRRCESLGYHVTAVVPTGEEALGIADVVRPELVLMDIRLGGSIDGIEAARQIHGQLDIPVVFVTAYSDDATLQRAKETGPFGYLLKPIAGRDLHMAIEMALHRHALEQQMKSWKELASALLEANTHPSLLLAEAATVTEANPSCASLLGMSGPEDLRGRSFLEFVQPSDRARWHAGIAGCVSADESTSVKLALRAAAGSPRPVHAHIRRLDSSAGKLLAYVVTFTLDNVTLGPAPASTSAQHTTRRRHQSLQRDIRFLGNLLQIHSGHAVRTGDRMLLDGLQRRLGALALVHTALASPRMPGVMALPQYLDLLLAELLSTRKKLGASITVDLQADGVAIGSDKALAVGMIIYELLSNALEHAFPDARAGTIHVHAHRNNGSSITISVHDDGVGLQHHTPRGHHGGFGLDLVRMMADQLRGTLLQSKERGTTFTLTFPV